MKRSEAIKVITAVLEKWENCKLEDETSDELLTTLDLMGMLPPPYETFRELDVRVSTHLGVTNLYEKIKKNEWESE